MMRLNFSPDIGDLGPVETDNAEAHVRRRLPYLLAEAEEWLANMPDRIPEDAGWGPLFPREQVEYIPRLLDALDAGDMWVAVQYALRVGYNEGRWFMYPQGVKATRRAKAMEPDAAYGAERRNMSKKGGQAKRKAPPADVLRAELDKLLSAGAHTKSRARRVLAARFDVSYSTVLRHTK